MVTAMKTLNQLTKKYRSQILSKSKLQEQINSLREQERALQSQVYAISQEIDFTKSLIDYCVLTGESPAEALLKNTKEQIRSTIENMSGWIPLAGTTISGLTVSNNLVTNVSMINAGTITNSLPLTIDPNNTINSLATRVSGSLAPGV